MAEQLWTAIESGQWYAVVALCVLLATYAWRKVKPLAWDRIPDGWRWLPPVLMGAAMGFAEAWQSGAEPGVAAFQAVGGAFAAFAAMGIAAAVKESPLPVDGGKGGAK